MTERTRQLSRRRFLFAVGVGGAVTATATVAKSVPEAHSARGNNDDKRATRGYHASQHVTAYYRTVKV